MENQSNARKTQYEFFLFGDNTRVRTIPVSETSFTAPKAMDASPFGTLSGELRNRIYHFCFQSQLAGQIHVDIRGDRARVRRNKKEVRSALALTATSRLLHNETLAIFWSKASFRIIADTLTAFSYPRDTILRVKPKDRADSVNEGRVANLRRWLRRSGILDVKHLLRPIELDLGVWDPSIYTHTQQPLMLRLIATSTMALTAPLESIMCYSLNSAAECTLIFRVSVAPSTALGPIYVPNDRKQALAVVEKLCKSRQKDYHALYQQGLFTRHGYSVVFNDIASCRAVADLLVDHIVEEKEVESDDPDGSV